ncbi:MAG: hypothetical protein COS15_03940 [Caldiserica bacterium CG02_land_8_20_14_3_00_36_38]|nr:hypothetical protein [Caldisericota bacterium]OIP13897.1 MAG: hypothetical protein AUJ99_00610 [Caldisericum sp. CG2_30_36_11]PIP50122.1 MAG: hypothetical protein COX13_00080 [Caldiserica bacterium CG23_combo_of_CG06-09_8_20_14_all_35_60]PIV55264.1 MAG: hypothetical protein COS15_03940 [Caldiserica bacterium CG02_land_8_20_14_3_00_36_38]PIX29818.1 MAG: hypothetical protein COZ65_00270 [Caldiserica bacterium CG_4_8_14_3_um_filter_35_18]
MKKVLIFSLVVTVFMTSVLLPLRAINADGENEGLNNPNFQKGSQPFPSLTAEEERLEEEKLQRYREWLSKQPKIDIKNFDMPISNDDSSKEPSILSITEYGSLTIYYRVQETSYYCGPATAQVILNYDWGMIGSSNYYTQSYLANYMGTNSTDGTYVYRLKNALNELKNPNKNPTAYWIYTLLPSNETDAANYLYTYLQNDITYNTTKQALAFHTNTYPKYGYDAWGERYGLIGYYNPSNSYEYHSTGHYVTGYGYVLYSDGRHRVKYADSWNHDYGWENCLGYHELDARNMATCINGNAGYLIW